jgi:hypothetical protein
VAPKSSTDKKGSPLLCRIAASIQHSTAEPRISDKDFSSFLALLNSEANADPQRLGEELVALGLKIERESGGRATKVVAQIGVLALASTGSSGKATDEKKKRSAAFLGRR